MIAMRVTRPSRPATGAMLACLATLTAWGVAWAAEGPCLGDFRFKSTTYLRRLRFVCVPGRYGPPRVNGRPDPKEWSGAARLSKWFVLEGKADKAAKPGEIWLAYDRAGLYVAGLFRSPAAPAKPAARKVEADPGSRTAFTVRVTAPEGDRYAFTFSPNGEWTRQRNGDRSWRGPVSFSAKRLEDGWRLEAVIPWRTLDMSTPRPFQALEASFALQTWDGREAARLGVFPRPGNGVLVFGDEAAYLKSLPRTLAKARFGVRLYMDRYSYDGNDPAASCRAVLTSALPARPLLAKSSLRLAVDAGALATKTLKKLTSNTLDFTVDLRKLKPGEHRLRVQIIGPKGAVRGAAERRFRITAKAVPPTLKRSVRLRLWRFPESLNWPEEAGVPIPKGELWGDGVRLLDPKGEPVPAEARAVARWGPKGSTQWLRVAFVAPPGAKELRLEYGARVRPAEPKRPVEVTESKDAVTIDTGAVRFTARKAGFRLFERVEVGALRRALPLSGQDLVVEDDRGESFLSSLDPASRVEIEEKGALQVTLRAEGWHVSRSGGRCGRYVVRLTAWAGSPIVRMSHTLILTADSRKVRYRDLAVRPGWIGQRVLFGAAGDKALTVGPNTSAYFLQWSGKNYTLVAKGKPQSGEGAGGWVDVSGKSGGVTTAIRDFAANYPKEFEWRDGRTLVVHLWPRHGIEGRPTGAPAGADPTWPHVGRLLDLNVPKAWRERLGAEAFAAASRAQAMGVAKTHEIQFFFHPPDEPTGKVQRFGRAVRRGAAASVGAEWLARSGVLGPAEVLPQAESASCSFVTEPLDCLLRRRDALGGGGMLDFGDTHHRYLLAERRYDLRRNWCGFARPGPMWGWAAHLLSGADSYRVFATEWSRHALDLDMCHYVSAEYSRLHGTGPQGKTVGGVCEPNAVVHWQGGGQAGSRAEAASALLDYYAASRRRAWDCARELGQAMLRQRTPDASATLALYHATWDSDYLQATEDTLRPWLKGRRLGSSFPVDAVASYAWWTGSADAKAALTRWAGAFLKTRPPLEDLNRLPLSALAHAFLQSGDERFLALAMGYERVLGLSVYRAGGPLERGDFTAPERPGLLGEAVAQTPVLRFARQRAERPILCADPRFRLRPWRGEKLVRGRARSMRRPHYELAAMVRTAKGQAAQLLLDLNHRGNLTVHVAPPSGGRPVFSRTLYPRRGRGGRRVLNVPISADAKPRELRLSLSSDAPFDLTAPIEAAGVTGLVWLAQPKTGWILSPGGRAVFRAPRGDRLRAKSGAGLHAMYVRVIGGAGRVLYWKAEGTQAFRLDGGERAARSLWEARAGMGQPIRLLAPEDAPLRVATEPGRHFDAGSAP